MPVMFLPEQVFSKACWCATEQYTKHCNAMKGLRNKQKKKVWLQAKLHKTEALDVIIILEVCLLDYYIYRLIFFELSKKIINHSFLLCEIKEYTFHMAFSHYTHHPVMVFFFSFHLPQCLFVSLRWGKVSSKTRWSMLS